MQRLVRRACDEAPTQMVEGDSIAEGRRAARDRGDCGPCKAAKEIRFMSKAARRSIGFLITQSRGNAPRRMRRCSS